jgi:CDP-glucose 4,6-dehydratase
MESLGIINKGTSFWQDRPVLITGATGLLGSWLTKALCNLEADIICLVRDWVPQSELVRSLTLERVKVVRGDLDDFSLLERILGEYEVDTVFNLAAQTIVPIANRNPLSTFEANIRGTWVLLEACRRAPTVKQIVSASSDKAYGEHERLPYTEQHALQGKHPYDVSKSSADLIAHSYAVTYSLPVGITRCGNFFGGGDLNWNRLIPGTIRSIIRGKQPIIRSDGRFVRDYFYVEDAAHANILLAENLAKDHNLRGEAFNFSNEQPLNALDVVDLILRLMQSKLEPEIRNEAKGEIRDQYLSAAKARKTLGWTPLFTVEDGLTRTIEWYRKFLGEKTD